jgi:hypothetical protein
MRLAIVSADPSLGQGTQMWLDSSRILARDQRVTKVSGDICDLPRICPTATTWQKKKASDKRAP